MPALKEAADTHDAVAAIIAATAEGELTLSEAATIAPGNRHATTQGRTHVKVSNFRRLVCVAPGIDIDFAQLDGQLWIDVASLCERNLRLIYVAFQRVGGGEIQIRIEKAKTGVDRFLGFVYRGVEMADAEFSRHKLCQLPILGSRGLRRMACWTSDFAWSNWPK
jgi:hypothetical protein